MMILSNTLKHLKCFYIEVELSFCKSIYRRFMAETMPVWRYKQRSINHSMNKSNYNAIISIYLYILLRIHVYFNLYMLNNSMSILNVRILSVLFGAAVVGLLELYIKFRLILITNLQRMPDTGSRWHLSELIGSLKDK